MTLKGQKQRYTIPPEYRWRFAQFEQAERMLRNRFTADGVSRSQIMHTFAAYAAVPACWRDPAFLVWAGLKGCTTSEDFLNLWRAEEEEIAKVIEGST